MDKIDIVYLWVDGSDKKWAAEKNKWLRQLSGNKFIVADAKASATNARWRDNGEFKYSLRSVAECLPWVNHIYIITGFGQVPKWLNTKHPKITIVPHEQIIPADALPTFNSTSIEMCIPNIPGLSERFLLMNDDMMFNRRVNPEFFFDHHGRAIVNHGNNHRVPADIDAWIERSEQYTAKLIRCAKLIHDVFGRDMYRPRPSHGIDPYIKSSWIECISHPLIKPYVEWQIRNKFRTRDDIQRWMINLYDVIRGRAVLRRVRPPKATRHHVLDWLYNTLHHRAIRRSPVYVTNAIASRRAIARAAIFCINDDDKNTPEIMRGNAEFLAARFPNKCEFEK